MQVRLCGRKMSQRLSGKVSEGLPETKRGSGCTDPLAYYEKRLPTLYDDSLLAGSNRHVSRLPELFSHFYQPSVADFALVDASRININFCEGSFECVRKFAGYLIPPLFFNHGDRYGLTFYRHLNTFRIGCFGRIK